MNIIFYKKYLKRLKARILILPIALFFNTAYSQTTLSPGDLAFLSLKVSNGDGFAFVTYVDICPNTIIYFTDNPYRNTGGFCTSMEEFCISLTVTTLIPAGTQITYNDGAPGTFTIPAGAGTIAFAFNSEAGSNNGFSSSGDNCFAFQGSYALPNFICAIKTSSYNAAGTVTCSNRAHTELPSSLTLGVNALFVNVGSTDGIYYDCGLTSSTQAALNADINNSSNWTSGSSTLTRPCSFTVTDAIPGDCSAVCDCAIWSEDFNTTNYPSRTTTGGNFNTINPSNDWTTTAIDCDDGTPFGTINQSYWGTLSGEFCCNDVEGLTCCSGGGDATNEWISESIDITDYIDVSICITFRTVGTMEPNTSATSCNNADDIIQGQYRIDGGAWQVWFFDDDEVNLSPATVSGLLGSTLELRILTGNKANAEFHYFDNICVSGIDVTVLPLNWLSFSAALNDFSAELNWITANESNTDYFNIERSNDGLNFSSIGRIAASGNSDHTISYSFKDFEPVQGSNYYRIQQFDLNGAFTYSATRHLYFESVNETFISYMTEGVLFNFSADKKNEIKIVNMLGADVGINAQNTNTFFIYNSVLNPGFYILILKCGNQFEHHRFLIR